MRPDYLLSNADIALSLLRRGHKHCCDRCGRGMHVRYASGLCVWCYNQQVRHGRDGQRTLTIERRSIPAPAPERAPAATSPAPKPALTPRPAPAH
jgi:hypothetical protein